MTQSTIRRWSNPEVILVATTLLEGPSVMLHAVYQAKLSGARILLVHVVRPSDLRASSNAATPFVLPSPAFCAVQVALNQMAKTFQREGIPCEPIILRGVAVEQISLLVKSRVVDRVIVGTRSARGVERLLTGSVAEELAAALDVPVCIVGHGAHPGPNCETPPGRILAATSFQPGSSLCVSFAYAFAEAHHARLTLLHVIDSGRAGKMQMEEARIAARQELASYIPRQAHDECQTVLAIREGDPSTEILEAARSLRHDFIVLGSPSDSVVSRILASGVIHRVVGEARCPVITIKSEAPAVHAVLQELFHTEPDPRIIEDSYLQYP